MISGKMFILSSNVSKKIWLECVSFIICLGFFSLKPFFDIQLLRKIDLTEFYF